MVNSHFFGIFKLVILLALHCTALSVQAEEVWIDVRSSIEHKMSNIEGDLRISHGEIVERVTNLYPNKDTNINLYCRSGGRAGNALNALQKAGYKNVKNVGSINHARELRNIEN